MRRSTRSRTDFSSWQAAERTLTDFFESEHFSKEKWKFGALLSPAPQAAARTLIRLRSHNRHEHHLPQEPSLRLPTRGHDREGHRLLPPLRHLLRVAGLPLHRRQQSTSVRRRHLLLGRLQLRRSPARRSAAARRPPAAGDGQQEGAAPHPQHQQRLRGAARLHPECPPGHEAQQDQDAEAGHQLHRPPHGRAGGEEGPGGLRGGGRVAGAEEGRRNGLPVVGRFEG